MLSPKQAPTIGVVVVAKVLGLYALALVAVVALAVGIPLFLVSLLPNAGVEVSRWFPDGLIFVLVSFLVVVFLVGPTQKVLKRWGGEAAWLSAAALLIVVGLKALGMLVVAIAFHEVDLTPFGAFAIATLGSGLMALGTEFIERLGKLYLEKEPE